MEDYWRSNSSEDAKSNMDLQHLNWLIYGTQKNKWTNRWCVINRYNGTYQVEKEKPTKFEGTIGPESWK